MENIHAWAVGMCAAAIIGSVSALLTPSGSMEKSMKTVISIFLICAVVLPLFKNKVAVNNDISTYFAESEEDAFSITNEVGDQTESYLKTLIYEILQKNGITCEDIVIQIETNEESVNVKSITVYRPNKDAETVCGILKKEAGIEVNVVM